MANLLNLLTPLVSAASTAKSASLEGAEIVRERKRKTLLDELTATQQAEDRERRTLMDELQRRNIESQIADRERVTPRQQVVDGNVVNLDTAQATPIQGMPTPQGPQYEERKEGGGVAIYENGQFKTWKLRPPTEREVNPMMAVQQEQQRFTREQGLADDFRQEQDIKDAKGVAGAVTTIRGALSNPSPQGDLAAIYALVKLYDPGSVVREGEISLTQSAASLPEQVRRMWQGWNTGQKLTPQMRADLASIANSIVDQRQSQINPTLARYGEKARRWGADSAAVAPNPFEGARINVAPEPTGGAVIPPALALKYGLTPAPTRRP